MPKCIGKRWFAILAAVLLLAVSVVTMAFFTDRVDHSMQFTTASFSADGYKLTRVAPEGPFCAGEDVTATLKESNTGSNDLSSVISMKATWVSPDTALFIFGNSNAADNAKLTIGGTNISYAVSADKKSITFDLPAHALTAGTKDKARDLTLTIPESFQSTGRIEFTFEKVVVAQDGGGFSETYDRTKLNASNELDYSVKVGWAASSLENSKALMGYLTEKDAASGKFGIQFEYAFNYNTSPMKDFASKTGAKWSYYKDKADRLTFVEGMTSIGDYAFPDFELVTSLSLPESLMSVGKWSFDNISIPTLTLPAALTTFKTMSFGHINELTEITFEQAANTEISFPTAGSTTGAFYVDPYVPTKIVGENPIAQGYDWITDQRRVAPVIRSYTYKWTEADGTEGSEDGRPDSVLLVPDTDSAVDFHETAEVRAKIKNVVFQDANGYYALPGMTPGDRNDVVSTTANMWDVSEAQNKSVIAYLKDDGTLIIAADGTKTVANANSAWLFADMVNIETIDATLYDTSRATTLEGWHAFPDPTMGPTDPPAGNDTIHTADPVPVADMPQNGAKQIVGTQGWDVSKVKSTKDMFHNASRLTTFNTNGWNTASLETMEGTFHGCSALQTLPGISGWNTSKVMSLRNVFSHCRGLTELDVSGWDVRKVEDMTNTFSDCGAPELDLHTWKTSSLVSLWHTFSSAAASSINVTGWDTSNVVDMSDTFMDTKNLLSIDLSSWKSGTVGTATYTDSSTGNIEKYTTSGFNEMFYNSGVKSINVTGWDMTGLSYTTDSGAVRYANGGGVYSMFQGCKNLTQITGLDTWTNTDHIRVLDRVFKDCESLTGLNISGWNTSNVTSMASTFQNCKALTDMDISGWNVAKCKVFTYTFANCEKMAEIDISGWDMTSAGSGYLDSMFNGCKSITSLTFPARINFLADKMAANCPNLTTVEFLSEAATFEYFTAAGEKYGAFYVAPDAGVTVPVVTKFITHGAGMAKITDSTKYNLANDNRALPTPTLAAQDSWYKGTTTKAKIAEIELVDSYVAAGNETEAWDASAAQDGSVMAYVDGTKLTIAGNGSEKIMANADSSSAFSRFSGVTSISGIGLLDTSQVTTMDTVFFNCSRLTSLDLSGWVTSKVTNMSNMFKGCSALTSVDVSNFDTSKVMAVDSMFFRCTKLTSLDLSGWDTSQVTNMSKLFDYCSALTSVGDLSGWNTSKVTSMSQMFYYCSALTSLDVSHFDTSQVTTMNGMFNNCSALTNLNVSSFDTSKVTTMNGMFSGCKAVTSLDVSKFDTSQVTSMSLMFNNCSALTSLDVSKFDTSKVTNMGSMFSGCSALASLDVSKFDTSKVTSMSNMFKDCSALTSLDVSKFDTSQVTNMGYMFKDCSALTSLDVSKFDTSQVTNMGYMFYECSALTSLDLSSFDTANISTSASMLGVFDSCNRLQTVTLSAKFKFVSTAGYLPTPSSTYISGATGKWYDTKDGAGYTPAELAAVTRTENRTYVAVPPVPTLASGNSWYKGTTAKSAITEIQIVDSYTPAGTVTEQWNADVDNSGSIKAYVEGTTLTIAGNGAGKIMANRDSDSAFASFTGITGIEGLNLLDTSETEFMSSMFYKCSGLTSLDVSGFDTSKVTRMNQMFTDCSSLTTLDVSKLNTENVWDMSSMFMDCTNLTTLNLSALDTSAAKDMHQMFYGCEALTNLDLHTFNTAKVTTMSHMFGECTQLASVDLTGWDTSNVEYMSNMFYQCSSLAGVDLTGFNTAKVTSLSGMFNGCTAFVDLDLSSFDTSAVTTMTRMFNNCRKLQTITLGAKFKFVGTDGYLPEPSSVYIPKADGKWYVNGLTKCYTPEELAAVTRVRAVTYSAIPGTDQGTGGSTGGGGGTLDGEVRWPAQSGSLTYTGSVQSPSWSGFDSTKMTISGTTSGTNAGTYTATFKPKDGYCWPDGTADAVSVTWKIGKAAGSLSVSPTTLTIGNDSTTGTITVTRAGNGVISAKSSNTSIATVSVSGNTITVTKKGSGSATITVSVAEGTNYLAPADKTVAVTCESVPTLASGSSWYKGTTDKSTITEIQIVDSYTPAGTVTEQWNADVNNDGSIKAYVEGTKLTIAGNGAGKIMANANTRWAFGNFSKATSISGMGLLDTSKVTDMYGMFYGCSALTSLDVSNFDTSKVTTMSSMFYGCSALTSLDLSKFDTSKVADMQSMFDGCSALTSLDLSNFDTSKVLIMGFMFSGCSTLTSLDLSGWNTSKVTGMTRMFYGCRALTSLDVSHFDTSQVTTMNGMFNNCSALTNLNVSSFDTSKVTKMDYMFYYCSALTSLDVSNFDTSKVTNMYGMFEGCKALTSLDLSKFDTSKVTAMGAMFRFCSTLTSLDVSNFDTSQVTDMGNMFYYCSALTSVGDLSGWDTSQVTGMVGVFDGCKALTSLDVSNFDTSKVTDMRGMFGGCSTLTSLDVSNFDTSKVTNMCYMFRDCNALTSLDVSNFDTSKVTTMRSMFDGCSALTSLDLSKFDTSKVADMQSMFYGCSALTSLDLSNFDTSKVTDMYGMFRDCSKLTKIYASNLWSTASVTSSAVMFSGCTKLSGKISYNSSKIDATYANYTTGYFTYKAASSTRSLSIMSKGSEISGYSISE